MSKKRRQHFVPKEYLRLFSNDKKTISIYVIDNGYAVSQAAISDQCYKNHFYGKDLYWENELAELETQWGSVFAKISNSNEYYPSNEERKLLQSFVIFQYQRTESNIGTEIDNLLSVESELLRMEIENRHKFDLSGMTREQIKNMILQSDPEHQAKLKQIVIQNSLSIAGLNTTQIDDLGLTIINYKTEDNLIICDNPIVYINLYSPYHVGLAMAGLIIILPLSPKKLLVFYDSKMYKQKPSVQSISNNNEIKHLNVFQLIKAKSVLLGSDVSDFDFLIKNPRLLKHRQENKQTSTKSIFGTKEEKLIHIRPPLCLYDCPLSFCKLPESIKRIPLGARDRFTRKHEQEWEEHFRIKPTLYKSIKETNANRNAIKDIKEANKYIFEYWKSE